ncbi:DNA replication/repair protein RecF [Clostridium estertheticum]|uniref:DNA replication/repair protein RecF n=1 Tax=Clostridium estertheticum TaxID=238834 RepID=UPI001C0AFDAF|nr:DNA replication/repair protein RecF [Clostridium estertheticum]MBU3217625.1 DNA replication/repair protein RecF [Clostridium estertheticum]WAG57511.1 DNA replication/repair protein RecF [Clostridium estertheticum]
MHVKYLQLKDFRNYTELVIELNKGINVFVGDNAQGKTNILEAIYYCSLAKSHRTNRDKELINWNGAEAYIKLYVCKTRLDKKIEIKIFKEGKKGVNINSIKVQKLSELVGSFNVIMFSPEDLNIVKESPSYRRKFLDIELCKLSRRYYYNLSQYKKILNERNLAIKKWNTNIDIIDVYDRQLSEFGAVIIKDRIAYIEKLNILSKTIHSNITSKSEVIEIKYLTQIKELDNIQESFYLLLCKNRRRDIETRTTSVGPHRDDFSIQLNGIDARIFGSQGQQRTSVLTIKFGALEIIKELTGEYPVLLLDDVLSELDTKRQEYILNSIKEVQTLITCTGVNNIRKYLNPESKIFEVMSGGVKEIT